MISYFIYPFLYEALNLFFSSFDINISFPVNREFLIIFLESHCFRVKIHQIFLEVKNFPEKYMDARSLVSLAVTNHEFYKSLMDDAIWKRMIFRDMKIQCSEHLISRFCFGSHLKMHKLYALAFGITVILFIYLFIYFC